MGAGLGPPICSALRPLPDTSLVPPTPSGLLGSGLPCPVWLSAPPRTLGWAQPWDHVGNDLDPSPLVHQPEQVRAGRPVAPELRPGPMRSLCRLVLVESTPQDLPFAAGSPSAQPLAQAWLQLLDTAQESVHVASYYWSLTGNDIGVNDSSSQPVRPLPLGCRLPWRQTHNKSPRVCPTLSRGWPGWPLGAGGRGQAGVVAQGWPWPAGGGPPAEAAAAPGQKHLLGRGHQLPDAGQELH